MNILLNSDVSTRWTAARGVRTPPYKYGAMQESHQGVAAIGIMFPTVGNPVSARDLALNNANCRYRKLRNPDMQTGKSTLLLTMSWISLLLLSAGCPALLNSSDSVSGTPFVNIPSSGNSTGGTLAPVPEVPDYGCDAPPDSESLAAEVLRLVNGERSSRGLSTLSMDDTLRLQAAKYACELINDDFFAHVNPVTGSTLEDRAEEFGYNYSIIGENLAAGQTTAIQVVQDWMDSEGHRANILRPDFTEIGIAIRVGGDFGMYWVQEFGRPSAEAGPQP